MKESIIKIIQDVSKKADVPGDDESLFDSGLLDSFALTDMVAALEEKFGIKVPDSDLNPRKFDTIEKIEAYVESRK
jgi:D-alanine--poly(phosphoribitol) ligase subunit 2